jgi:hypothetical protein
MFAKDQIKRTNAKEKNIKFLFAELVTTAV